MAEQQPLYNFYCVICGTAFTPSRAHATTCKMECRVIRAGITKTWVEQIPESEKTPIDKSEVEAGYKKASGGREIPKAALAQHKAKEPEKEESAAGKLLGKKNAEFQPKAPEMDTTPSSEKKDGAKDVAVIGKKKGKKEKDESM